VFNWGVGASCPGEGAERAEGCSILTELPDHQLAGAFLTRVERSTELATRIFDLATNASRATISAAESCSGGGIASAITAISGSSAYFLGSIVAYANEAKRDVLGVPDSILESRGAVSPECAVAMAEGSRARFGSDIAVSTTGIAGPTGATPRKPVGLVYLAQATADGTHVEEHHFPGDRAAVTQAAVIRGLELIVDALEKRS
jgi:PncC family amidohydrolase